MAGKVGEGIRLRRFGIFGGDRLEFWKFDVKAFYESFQLSFVWFEVCTYAVSLPGRVPSRFEQVAKFGL